MMESINPPNKIKWEPLSAIHLAGIIGDPKTLRCFLNVPKFDLSVTIQGCSTLHFVLDGTPLTFSGKHSKSILKRSLFCDETQYGEYLISRDDVRSALSDEDREVCVSILIQAGLDVWEKMRTTSSQNLAPMQVINFVIFGNESS